MEKLLKKPSANTAQDLMDKFNIKELIEFERFCRDNATVGRNEKMLHGGFLPLTFLGLKVQDMALLRHPIK